MLKHAKYINKLGNFVNPYITNSTAIDYNLLPHSLAMAHFSWQDIVALILVGFNKENPDSDRGDNGEGSENQGKQALVLNSNETSDQRDNAVYESSY